MAEKYPSLAPEHIRAVITTKWTKTGYLPITVKSIESYSIEMNMDQDSDNFQLVVGDPRNSLSALMNRDSEIRIQIFGIGLDANYLLTGLVDDIEFSEENRYVIQGRDRSAIAVDTFAEAGKWNGKRANEFIQARAEKLGVARKFNLAPVSTKKTFRTDGSETEWEFWYRLIRKELQWLWFSSDGILTSSTLNYNQASSYFFGVPPLNAKGTEAHKWIPVERVSYKKSTQTRLGRVMVFYNSGSRTYSYADNDPLVEDWDKRPLKYIEDRSIHTEQRAKKAVREEIFESKVGALEIKVLIPDVGIIIRQNRIASLHIPEIDLGGDWFVVGSRIVGDESGYMQEVRLREKGYAISKRIPTDPEVAKEPGKPEDIADCVPLCEIIPRPDWCQYFINAASKWRNAIPYDLYLAVLWAICDTESAGIWKNIRSDIDGNGNPAPGVKRVEYFKWNGQAQDGINSEAEWKESFKNEAPGDTGTFAVGPMQLYTADYKYYADRFDGGQVSELRGNRWLPEANIWTSAYVLSERKGANREETLWAAVKAYNGAGAEAEAYMKLIQRKVYNSPGYLKKIQEALAGCAAEGEFGGDDGKEICSAKCRTLGDPCWGGSKEIADRLLRIALAVSPGLTYGGKRCTKYTENGGVSDHYYGRIASWAYDIGFDSPNPTPAKDVACKAMLEAFEIPYIGQELVKDVYCGDFRVQFLYRTQEGGNHNDHIHVGVRNNKLDQIIDAPNC